MTTVSILQELVSRIDEAESPAHQERLVCQFVETLYRCDEQIISAWMEAERRTIDGADLGAAVQRAQMVTSALSLGANVWGKGAAKVGSLLHRWIGRLQTPLVKLRNAAGGKEVSLQVSVKGVTIGITW